MLRLIARNDQPEKAPSRLRKPRATNFASISQPSPGSISGWASSRPWLTSKLWPTLRSRMRRGSSTRSPKPSTDSGTDYIEGGAVGPAPAPLVAERSEATAILVDRQRTAAQLRGGEDAVTETMLRLATDRRALAEQLPDLVGAVLVEEAETIAQRYERALREVLHAEAVLNALSDATLVSGFLRAGEGIRLLRKNGTTGRSGPLITTADLAEIRQRAAAFPSALEPTPTRPFRHRRTP